MNKVEEINKAIEGLSVEDQLKVSVGWITIQEFFTHINEMSSRMCELADLLSNTEKDE